MTRLNIFLGLLFIVFRSRARHPCKDGKKNVAKVDRETYDAPEVVTDASSRRSGLDHRGADAGGDFTCALPTSRASISWTPVRQRFRRRTFAIVEGIVRDTQEAKRRSEPHGFNSHLNLLRQIPAHAMIMR